MSDSPLFSCIVPVHNGEAFLSRCLRSVLNQSEQRFELIVVNDASSDGSLALATHWAERYPARMRVIDSGLVKAQGIIRSYLAGVAVASAPYLAFLEQDDTWSENYLRSKASIFQADSRHEIGVIFSPHTVVRDGLYGLDMSVRQFLLTFGLPRNHPFDNFAGLLQFNNVTTFSAFVCRRDLWDLVPIPDDSGTVYYDWWVLTHLSLLSSFCLDTKSQAFWRCSKQTTLGSQTFHSHRRKLTSFLVSLYESLDQILSSEKISGMHISHSKVFLSHKKTLRAQLKLLNDFNLVSFLEAFSQNPLWSLKMLVSSVVNRLKKSSS